MKINVIDICLPSYFLGRNTEWFCVPLNKDMTYRELWELSKEYQFSDHIETDEQEFNKAIDKIFSSLPFDLDRTIPGTENIDDDGIETPYIFYSVEF